MTCFLTYEFVDPTLLKRALTHRSASGQHNERLEFLGDAILGQVIAVYLYREFPNADEGQLTRTRAHLVNKESLAAVARRLELGGHILLGEGELKSGGWRRDSILANTLEAVIGALYLDAGYDRCGREITRMFEDMLADIDPEKAHKDAKTRLQELLQARGMALPVYTPVDVDGPPHDQRFKIECRVGSLPEAALAEGKSRRAAEQGAAARMLEHLENIQ